MSGGGKGQMAPSTSDPVQASQPPYLNGTSPAVMGNMPGQLEAIAQQLGIGFGQPPAAMLAHLKQINQPAQTLNYNAKTAPAGKPAAKTSPLNMGGRGGMPMPEGFSQNDRRDITRKMGYDPFTGR